MKNKKNILFGKKAMLSYSQILILLVGTFAFAWMIGGVKGDEGVLSLGGDVPSLFSDTPSTSTTPSSPWTGGIKLGGGAPSAFGSNKGGSVVPPDTSSTGTMFGDWLLKKGWFGGENANLFGNIVSGFGWALTAYGVISMLGSFLPEKYKPLTDALSISMGAGIMTGKLAYGLVKAGGWWEMPAYSGLTSFMIGAVVTALIFYMTYKKERTFVVSYTCNPWDAPVGGKDCEKCNNQDLPCSEYQCRSLGQACTLENKGTSKEMCIWSHPDDVSPPIITPSYEFLTDGFKYTPDNSISPPDRGVFITNPSSKLGDNCIPAFTPLSFGITTDEPARCKIDYTRKSNFEDMGFYFGGDSLLDYNHSQVLSLPGASADGNVTLANNGKANLYVRCQDANGNYNTATYVFKFCVDKSEDTTAPEIVSTNLLNGMPIAYNQTEANIEVYTNEPADCKWSRRDMSYTEMEEQMTCNSNVLEMNAQMLYKCSSTLTGLKSKIENKFYFRCKDQPGADEGSRNTNAESYEFSLIGTQELVIDSVAPNATIKDASEVVNITLEAETSAGYKEGESACYYSDTGEEDSYIMFFNTNSYAHTQDLYLTSGTYTYYIKCIDLGGNYDVEKTSFTVETDTSAPNAARVYKEENYLKVITDEEGSCVYSTQTCSYLFKDGNKMTTLNSLEHFTDWNVLTTLYIKCKDIYGNEPSSASCSIVAKPFGE